MNYVHISIYKILHYNSINNKLDLISKIVYQLILKEGDNPIYLYINSHGGEVVAGNNLINYLLYNNKNIICIANYAASMAFAILQACNKRYGTKYLIMEIILTGLILGMK